MLGNYGQNNSVISLKKVILFMAGVRNANFLL